MSLGRQGHAISSACKVAPSSAFLSSPNGRHSRLSYRRVFFLCSLSIRINGAPIEMTSLNRLTALAVAFLGMISTYSQQVRAHDFTLFEPATVPPKTDQHPATPSLPPTLNPGPAAIHQCDS